MRLLLDPTAGEGGGPSPPPPPAQQPPAPPPATPPPAPTGVTLSPEQHKALLDAAAERDALKVAEAEREKKRKDEQEERLRKQGEFEKLLSQRDADLKAERDRLADFEARTKRSERRRELALALAGAPILEGWPEKLMQLWEPQMETVADGDGWRVRSLDGKTPAEYVKEQLARPEFAAIVRAQTPGGVANRGSGTGREAPGAEPKVHPALLDYFRRQEEAARVGQPAIGLRALPSSQ